MTATVIHVIPSLSPGGGGRAVLTAAVATTGQGSYRHEVASLRPADPAIATRAAQAGLIVHDAPPADRLAAEIARADIVHVHFWNSPELAWLLRSPWPPARLVTWCHVGGATAPQVLPAEVAELSDVTVASTPLTSTLEHLRRPDPLAVVAPVADLERLRGRHARAHRGFAVGYVGTVDPVKMHPDFVSLCSRVGAEQARFIVCGSGDGFAAIAREADSLGTRDRFELRGYVEDVGALLAGCDVFGYPLRADNYSAAELSLQEAMHMGVPPVVLPHGGAAETVTDGVTGIVARDERAYVRAIELLAADPSLRRRLGENARRHARSTWSLERAGSQWAAIYTGLLELPKRGRSWPGAGAATGAELFVAGLCRRAEEFRVSLAAGDLEAALAADDAIAATPPPLANAEGGVLDYRRRYPSDPHLRLWAGLVLHGQGRRVFAAGEFAAAIRLGCDPRRAAPRLAELTGDLDLRETARGRPAITGRAV